MRSNYLYYFTFLLLSFCAPSSMAQGSTTASPEFCKTDTLPRERLCGVKAYLPETIEGVYRQSYGINLYKDFPDFPRLILTGNDRNDIEILLSAIETYIDSNESFRKRIGRSY